LSSVAGQQRVALSFGRRHLVVRPKSLRPAIEEQPARAAVPTFGILLVCLRSVVTNEAMGKSF